MAFLQPSCAPGRPAAAGAASHGGLPAFPSASAPFPPPVTFQGNIRQLVARHSAAATATCISGISSDVLYDLAFLLMDVLERGLRREANLLLNRYLVESREPAHLAGLAALPLFISIRAAIRAKVTVAGLAYPEADGRERALEDCRRYFGLAEAVLTRAPPCRPHARREMLAPSRAGMPSAPRARRTRSSRGLARCWAAAERAHGGRGPPLSGGKRARIAITASSSTWSKSR